jgi:hypothetical protein
MKRNHYYNYNQNKKIAIHVTFHKLNEHLKIYILKSSSFEMLSLICILYSSKKWGDDGGNEGRSVPESPNDNDKWGREKGLNWHQKVSS